MARCLEHNLGRETRAVDFQHLHSKLLAQFQRFKSHLFSQDEMLFPQLGQVVVHELAGWTKIKQTLIVHGEIDQENMC